MDIPDSETLRASTVETVLKLLEMQLEHRHAWAERHFPEAAARDRGDYEDVDQMSNAQADAVRHLLLEQIAYGWKRIRRTPTIMPEPDEEVREWKVRLGLYREAIDDICECYGLAKPKDT